VTAAVLRYVRCVSPGRPFTTDDAGTFEPSVELPRLMRSTVCQLAVCLQVGKCQTDRSHALVGACALPSVRGGLGGCCSDGSLHAHPHPLKTALDGCWTTLDQVSPFARQALCCFARKLCTQARAGHSGFRP
jgi:hypothetical protein